jgi:DNA-binding MarR family transcriptional regulator
MQKMKSSTRKFDSVQQEAYLAIWRTYDRLRAIEEALFSEWNLSAQQYNVLRLLESANPGKIPTLSLTKRLISRAPDITRMLDRLEENGWIERERSLEDRRAVLVGITKTGLDLIKQLRRPLAQCHEKQMGHLTPNELKTLCDLLSRVREPHETDDGFWK